MNTHPAPRCPECGSNADLAEHLCRGSIPEDVSEGEPAHAPEDRVRRGADVVTPTTLKHSCDPALWRTADPKAIGRALYHRLTIVPAGSDEWFAISEEVYRALKEAAPGALRRLVEDDEEAAKQEKRRARIVDGHEFGGGDAPWEHR